ncbi:hypothetical protein GVAV_000566 [Gurleya vavrai]
MLPNKQYENSFFSQPQHNQFSFRSIKGSSETPFVAPRLRDEGTYMYFTVKNIISMSEYKDKSNEEIRSEDYQINRKPSVVPVQYQKNMIPLRKENSWGSTTPVKPFSSFGNNINPPNSPFSNQTTGFGQNNNFLSSQPNQSFNQPSNSFAPLNTTPFSTQQSSTPFGQNNPFKSSFTSPFGSTTSNTTGTNAFGNNANNTLGSNAFGSINAGSNTFGSSNASSNTFGSSNALGSSAFGNISSGTNTPFGTTASNSTPFGTTSSNSTPFGTTASNPTPFGNAPPTNSFGNAPLNSSFGTAPANSSFSTAPLNSSFGNSLANTSSFSTTPANTSSFGNSTSNISLFNPTPNTFNSNNPFGSSVSANPNQPLSSSVSNTFGPTSASNNPLSNSTSFNSSGTNSTVNNPFGSLTTNNSVPSISNPFNSLSQNNENKPLNFSSNFNNQPQQPFLSSNQNNLSQTQSNSSFFDKQNNSLSNTTPFQSNLSSFTPLNNSFAFNAPSSNINQTFSTQPSFSQNLPNQSQFSQTSTIDNSLIDPYMISGIKFEKFDSKEINLKKLLPEEVFKDELKKEDKVKTKINRRITSEMLKKENTRKKDNIYTVPSVDELKRTEKIKNLKIVFGDNAIIEFLEDVYAEDVCDINKKLLFFDNYVVSSELRNKGLNRKARVILSNYWPVKKDGVVLKGKFIDFPEKGIQERFVYELIKDKDRKFVDYSLENGKYVYEVDFFDNK